MNTGGQRFSSGAPPASQPGLGQPGRRRAKLNELAGPKRMWCQWLVVVVMRRSAPCARPLPMQLFPTVPPPGHLVLSSECVWKGGMWCSQQRRLQQRQYYPKLDEASVLWVQGRHLHDASSIHGIGVVEGEPCLRRQLGQQRAAEHVKDGCCIVGGQGPRVSGSQVAQPQAGLGMGSTAAPGGWSGTAGVAARWLSRKHSSLGSMAQQHTPTAQQHSTH